MIIDNLLDLLYTGDISKKEIEQRLSGSQYAKAKQKIETVYLKRLENQAELWRKEMIKIMKWLQSYGSSVKQEQERHV